MRIAYLSTFYPFRGGIAQFNASLYRELEKEHEVRAFTFSRQYPDMLFPGKTQYVTADEHVDAIPATALLDSVNPVTYLTSARKIKAFRPDVLIMKYWMSFFGPSLGTVAKHMPQKTKVLTILDNVIPHEKRFFDKPFTSYFLRQNDGFVAMSDSVERDLYSLLPGAKCLRKDHPLYDHFGAKMNREEACRALQLDPALKTLLFFGFIRDYKGLDVLLRAFDRLGDDYQLVIAGETYGSFESYAAMIRELKNRDHIHVFNDYISDDRVPLFFSASDVCVLPYKAATQSGITSIAYHFDLPLIATDVGGLKESVHHLETGIIVPQCEPEAIAGAVQMFFEQNLKLKLSDGIRNVKQTLSWQSFARAITEFTNQL